MLAVAKKLGEMWSATGFADPHLHRYAEKQKLTETRRGVQLMALLSIATQISIGTLLLVQGASAAVLSTNILIGLLSLHVMISAAFVHDTRALHMLGMAFLIIAAVAVTILAHRTGELSIGMMAAVVMLFVAIPLVPWALREALTIISLTYILLTLSLKSVPGRFDSQSIVILQMLIVGAALIVIVVSGRNTLARKQEIRARYELESAHRQMELLSMQDHLTGAWNRRFVDEKFPELLRSCESNGESLQMAILDIDDFKGINDRYGHHAGDQILIELAEVFVRHLGEKGDLIRLGGDEFQILYCGDDLRGLIDRAVSEVQRNAVASGLTGNRKISLSAGIVSTGGGRTRQLDELYKTADRALYSAKHERQPAKPIAVGEQPLAMSGTWRL